MKKKEGWRSRMKRKDHEGGRRDEEEGMMKE